MGPREIDTIIVAAGARLAELGRPKADLGRLLALDSKQVNRLFNGERRLQPAEADKLKAWLRSEGGGQNDAGGVVLPLPGMVPLYGWVGAASDHRLTFAQQSMRGYVQMHPAQAHMRDAFALEVADISMSPRYEPGEIVYVASHRWPTRGQDCVVVTKSNEGLLKRYVTRDAKSLTLQQLNPAREVSVALDDFEAIHAVIGRS